MKDSTISSFVTPLLRAMRNCPRNGSSTPSVAAIVTETRARVRVSRCSVRGHASPKAFYVDKLAEGVATIAAAFWPKPVIVRLSDFKSN